MNAFKDVGAGMRNIFGGRAKSYENELASGVSDALAEMEQQAAQLGADAVVGVDIDYETVGNNMLMVSTSGSRSEAQLTATQPKQLPTSLTCHNNQFGAQLRWSYSGRFAVHIECLFVSRSSVGLFCGL